MELRSTYPEQYNPSCFQFAFPAITGITTDKDGLMLEDMLMRVAGGKDNARGNCLNKNKAALPRKVGEIGYTDGDTGDVYIVIAHSDVQSYDDVKRITNEHKKKGLSMHQLGIDKCSLGIDKCSLGTDKRSLGIDKFALGIDKRSLGIDKYALGTDKFALRIDKRSLGIDQRSLGLASKRKPSTKTRATHTTGYKKAKTSMKTKVDVLKECIPEDVLDAAMRLPTAWGKKGLSTAIRTHMRSDDADKVVGGKRNINKDMYKRLQAAYGLV